MNETNENGKRPLPEGWVYAPLRNVAEVYYGKGLTKGQRDENGKIPVFGSSGIVGYHTEALTNGPSVIIGRKGAAGAIHYCPSGSWPIDTAYYVSFADGIDAKYAYYALHTLELQTLDRSTAIPSLSRDDLYAQFLPIAPIPTQHRIVAEIEKQFTRLDTAVAALRRAKANLTRYKAAVLKAAVEGRLVPRPQRSSETSEVLLQHILAERRARWQAANPKKQYVEPKRPNVEGLGELPEGWVWATVEEVGNSAEQPVLTGPFGSSLGRDDFISQGVPLLTIGCLKETGITLGKAFYVSDEKAVELDRYRVREGDILFSRMAAVGRAGYVPASLEGSLINYHLMRLRLNVQAINPDYFIYFVRGSDAVESYIREVNHGVTRDGINTTQLLSLPVALPPEFEQRRIVEELDRRLSIIQTTEQTLDANLARAERLRQAVLARAFRGELVGEARPARPQRSSETSEVWEEE